MSWWWFLVLILKEYYAVKNVSLHCFSNRVIRGAKSTTLSSVRFISFINSFLSNWPPRKAVLHYNPAPVVAPNTEADLGGGCRGCAPPWDDLRFSNTTGILQKKTMWFIGVEVEQETSVPPPKKKSWIRPCNSNSTNNCFRYDETCGWHIDHQI